MTPDGAVPEVKKMQQMRSSTSKRPCQRVVGVISSLRALFAAARLRQTPDLFELRLDALRENLPAVAETLPGLRAPLIVTARHPREGGRGNLSAEERRQLLERFMPQAALLDLELRSLSEMKALLAKARRQEKEVILSIHDFEDTPTIAELLHQTRAACAHHPAIIKLATRTETAAQLARLISFFQAADSIPCPLAVMGIGRRGRQSRRELGQLGSALLYVSFGKANVAGQPSWSQLKRARSAYIMKEPNRP